MARKRRIILILSKIKAVDVVLGNCIFDRKQFTGANMNSLLLPLPIINRDS